MLAILNIYSSSKKHRNMTTAFNLSLIQMKYQLLKHKTVLKTCNNLSQH